MLSDRKEAHHIEEITDGLKRPQLGYDDYTPLYIIYLRQITSLQTAVMHYQLLLLSNVLMMLVQE